MAPLSRRATHSGSWYSSSPSALTSQLDSFLSTSTRCLPCSSESPHNEQGPPPRLRALIAPHAGYSFSGETAAWAYTHLLAGDEGRRGTGVGQGEVKRIFLLGPSHHFYTRRCALSSCHTYETPLGALQLDAEVADQLRQTGLFDTMEHSVDEAEHSIEMHLPYIRHVFGPDHPVRVVPILVGALDRTAEATYGRALAPYLLEDANLFIISSDFCHWGRRFKYTHYDPSAGEIFQSIEALDRKGMRLIEQQDADGFADYQHAFHNTICGRHPIAVLLHALDHARSFEVRHEVQFVRYAQSSQCRSMTDSSVSYASAVVWRVGGDEPVWRAPTEKVAETAAA